jgi:hypothetical protein
VKNETIGSKITVSRRTLHKTPRLLARSGLYDGIRHALRRGTWFKKGPLLWAEKPIDFNWQALMNGSRVLIKNEPFNRLKEESRRGRLHDMLARCGDVYRTLATSQ